MLLLFDWDFRNQFLLARVLLKKKKKKKRLGEILEKHP